MSYSAKVSSGTNPKPLPAINPTDDTYDWAAIQTARNGLGPPGPPPDKREVVLLKATPGQTLPTITLELSGTDEEANPVINPGSVDASSKWFSFAGVEYVKSGSLKVTLGVIAGTGRATAKGRVVRVAAVKGGSFGAGGAGVTFEYYYAIA